MNLKFIVNDYVLIWNLLFQASISENIHKLKQKIWINYKREYSTTFKDNTIILKDYKNFIPDDDTVYELVLENKSYERIKNSTDKYRIKLVELWDLYKKDSIKELKKILRFDIKMYHVLVVPEALDIVDSQNIRDAKINTIVWGKKLDNNNPLSSIISLIHEIVKKELREFRPEYKDIVDAVVELAILNEFATRLTGTTHYLNGDNTLKFLKKQIYPYWLMYLGVEKEDMTKYMARDRIAFDTQKYDYEKELRKIDIFDFIDFCIKNQKNIVKINELEIL